MNNEKIREYLSGNNEIQLNNEEDANLSVNEMQNAINALRTYGNVEAQPMIFAIENKLKQHKGLIAKQHSIKQQHSLYTNVIKLSIAVLIVCTLLVAKDTLAVMIGIIVCLTSGLGTLYIINKHFKERIRDVNHKQNRHST